MTVGSLSQIMQNHIKDIRLYSVVNWKVLTGHKWKKKKPDIIIGVLSRATLSAGSVSELLGIDKKIQDFCNNLIKK